MNEGITNVAPAAAAHKGGCYQLSPSTTDKIEQESLAGGGVEGTMGPSGLL